MNAEGTTLSVDRTSEVRPAILEIKRLQAKVDAMRNIVAAALAINTFAGYSTGELAGLHEGVGKDIQSAWLGARMRLGSAIQEFDKNVPSEKSEASSFTLRQLQEEHREWSQKNFGDQPAYRALLGAVEEIGELAHAHLKEEQEIRGSKKFHEDCAKDSVADTIIFLTDYCSRRGWDFEKVVLDTWTKVSRRDWKADPQAGGERKEAA